jgi:threonine dehydratase
VAVSDADIMRPMAMAADCLGLIVELTGAAGLAAILADVTAFTGHRTATIFTGDNITVLDLSRSIHTDPCA